MRPLILDLLFRDDRMFVLELRPVQTVNFNPDKPGQREDKWGVVTRRNVPGYPVFRCDHFYTHDEARAYYEKVVVQTPLVSLENKPMEPEPTLEEYRSWLVSNNYFDPVLNPNAPQERK